MGTIPLKISKEAIYRRIGQDDGKNVSKRVAANVDKAISVIEEIAVPKAVYKLVSVNNINGEVIVGDGITFDSKKITQLLCPCEKAMIFVVTLGKEIDELIQESLLKHPYYGYIMDAVASIAVESAAEYIQKTLEKEIAEIGKITLRYSPGYCDWPLCEQEKIFDILPNEKIDVNLSDQCCMEPRKSISGVIGVAPRSSDEFIKNLCKYCKNNNCPYRREE